MIRMTKTIKYCIIKIQAKRTIIIIKPYSVSHRFNLRPKRARNSTKAPKILPFIDRKYVFLQEIKINKTSVMAEEIITQEAPLGI